VASVRPSARAAVKRANDFIDVSVEGM